jgi:hypothetical protein
MLGIRVRSSSSRRPWDRSPREVGGGLRWNAADRAATAERQGQCRTVKNVFFMPAAEVQVPSQGRKWRKYWGPVTVPVSLWPEVFSLDGPGGTSVGVEAHVPRSRRPERRWQAGRAESADPSRVGPDASRRRKPPATSRWRIRAPRRAPAAPGAVATEPRPIARGRAGLKSTRAASPPLLSGGAVVGRLRAGAPARANVTTDRPAPLHVFCLALGGDAGWRLAALVLVEGAGVARPCPAACRPSGAAGG